MRYRYVFLLGRPGCGKSALYRQLKKRILDSGQAKAVERVDDFPKLWARCLEDDAREREGQDRIYSTPAPTSDGHYRLTDYSVFDEILKEVNTDVLQIDRPDHLVFIEYSRPSYVQAIQNFDRRILAHCIAIYMDVSFEICWARNVARSKAALAGCGDDHLVPRRIMEEQYLHDDPHSFIRYMQDQNIPVFVVNNEAEGEDHLREQVEALISDLLGN
jgi:hypothetical protein